METLSISIICGTLIVISVILLICCCCAMLWLYIVLWSSCVSQSMHELCAREFLDILKRPWCDCNRDDNDA